MKLPLWARNREGKLEPFPYHLLSRLSDGSLGFSFPEVKDHSDMNLYFGKFRHHFEWNPVDYYPIRGHPLEYRLKQQ